MIEIGPNLLDLGLIVLATILVARLVEILHERHPR